MNAARAFDGGGFGNVGLGVGGSPSRTRTRPELCEGMGHPGATYNAAMDMTWCLCGAEITFGNTAVPHVACCDGPLTERLTSPGQTLDGSA